MVPSLALSRRRFVGLGASAAAFSSLAGSAFSALAEEPKAATSEPDSFRGLKVGVASYSLSKLPRDKAIAVIKRVGLHYVSIKDAHMPLKSSTEQRKAIAKEFRDAGIVPLSCGNIKITDDESDARNSFEYARDAGIPTIVCSPNRTALPMLDKLVKEFDIKLAIHNHGPEDKIWPSPFDVWEAVQSFDPRIGLCIDVGHTARAGVDPSEAIRKCSARLYDLHIKDLARIEKKSIVTEVGRGVLDIPKMLATLVELKFPYHVGLEHEKDMADPLPGVAESIGYIHGVLATLPKS